MLKLFVINVIHNYFDGPTKLFSDLSSKIFRHFNKTVLSMLL